MIRVGIIRHGSTPWNKQRRAQGSSNIPLDDEGRNEAEKLALRLEKEDWSYIYASPLARASETAEIIQKRLQIPLIKDDRLREVGGGQIEGTTEQERIDKWGQEWRTLELGMEKKEDALHRVLSLLEEIEEKHEEERVLVVSHGSLISHLVREIVSGQSVDGHINNTSITEVIRDVGDWELELFNCTRHLDEN
ncbi:histidine phosphatase family protein [Halobacillus salinus]|uniref:Histidine phosphatase family protein n=1 Tax=Halobacillus salinus TaxID=192814 RepID=A0A4Z0GYF0_9BACI|nr:histidine phosphatase family protein [Halobacillus salinus]TGB02254.1 histidine phosphatase family protein [Halobacillus salinus]